MGIAREHSIGRYELLIELGHGGMAELLLGRLHGAGGFAKLVAIKRILPHLGRDPEFRAMFLEEGRIASRLSHPNVCQVFELDDADGELFLAMEYLDGVGWDRLLVSLPLAAPAGPPLAITAGVLAQAADGLHYAHTLRDVEGKPTPVVHRDVSPQNLFITLDGVCKVLDFGVSKMMTDGPRTKSGVVKGKLPYMAPEQIRGEPVDARTDVFSLGVCLWEALAGERLYDRSTDFLIWKAITEEDAPAITMRWPACPPEVAELVRRSLARDAANRLPSARAFAEELRAAVPTLASTAAIADAMRAACAQHIATRHALVATAVSTKRPGLMEQLADRRRSSEDVDSAAQTLESGRSAALTLDDKRGGNLADDVRDPGATTDLRSGSRTAKEVADIRLRDKSHVVLRDSERALARPPSETPDPHAMADRKHARLGLVIGGLAAIAVLALVIFVATRPAAMKAQEATMPAMTSPPDAAAVIDAAPIVVEIDAAEVLVPILPKPTPRPPPVRGVVHPPTPPVPAPSVDATPGQLSVSSDPYATIYLDGRKLGDTPLFRERLTAGKHAVRAVRGDGREQSVTIEIEAGKERNLGKLRW